jgi:hypothetical protein
MYELSWHHLAMMMDEFDLTAKVKLTQYDFYCLN